MDGKDDDFRKESARELIAKLQRKKRALKGAAGERWEALSGISMEDLICLLKESSPGTAGSWLRQHGSAVALLDRTFSAHGQNLIVSDRHDAVWEVSHGYGRDNNRKPSDYLDSFKAIVESHANQMPALLVVTQRPRDLTREDLRQLKLALDQEGYTEKAVQSAWSETRNEDIAATIIGYIRQLALGSPLVPFSERVDHAVQRLRKAHSFTDPQRKWLERIAKQIKVETVVDREALDQGQFQAEGGFARLNKVFDGQLEALLRELSEAVWQDAG
jgi:type I restriction enzyme R subunit